MLFKFVIFVKILGFIHPFYNICDFVVVVSFFFLFSLADKFYMAKRLQNVVK